jgi:hypothetical protein
MIPASDILWPLASSPERARWAVKAVERYLHMARVTMTQPAVLPRPRAAFPAQALDLTQRLSEGVEHRVDCGRPWRGRTSSLDRLEGKLRS